VPEADRARSGAVAPIDGRVGHVGEIESLTVDGRRWFFGFHYGSDLVVSPLIDDAGAMAGFAAAHMRQRDSAHPADHWSEPVELSVDESELTGADTDRELDSGTLAGHRRSPRAATCGTS
jgi:hypothetical protein